MNIVKPVNPEHPYVVKLQGQRKRLLRAIQISITFMILSCNLSLANGKSLNTTNTLPQDQSPSPLHSSPHEGSAERIKRQLFRGHIPHHRPLSGNLYARHHGYPHPGRWHANQQEIIGPNYDSGLHFDNPNLILTDEDFNRYGSTLQHLDEHRIQTNPEPILHEYPAEYGKVVTLGQGQQKDYPSSEPVSLPIPVVATHHHIHNHQPSIPFNGQQFEHVVHGHAVIHSVGESYSQDYHDNKYPPSVTKSKPFFGFKLPHLFGHKNFNVSPFWKGLWGGRYGSTGSSAYKRKGASISWSSVEHH